MSRHVSRLFVLWSDPKDGSRHIVGELGRDKEGFTFAYRPELDRAVSRGFSLLPEFPEQRDRYMSRHLFGTFAQRIPAPARPDFAQMMDAWGVPADVRDDPMEILARSGGIQFTDRIELAEYRADDDPLEDQLLFRVAGQRYQKAQARLEVGDTVTLLPEKDNPHDDSATLVLMREGQPIGYVPRQYSRLISRHLQQHHSIAAIAVHRLLVPSDRDRWVICARRVDSGARSSNGGQSSERPLSNGRAGKA